MMFMKIEIVMAFAFDRIYYAISKQITAIFKLPEQIGNCLDFPSESNENICQV